MPCRRGQCAGIPLCSAGVECVGFEIDAGQGCTGLAIGQSRIQINAAGEIEICSNVGGVCTCETVCVECLTQILATNDCTGGIGTDYAIRQADLVGGILTLDGAPEHTSISDSFRLSRVEGPGVTGLEVVGTKIEQARTQIQLTNPSLCRDMSVAVTGVASMGLEFPTGRAGFRLSSRVSIDSSLQGVDVARLGPTFLMPALPYVFADFPLSIEANLVAVVWAETIGPGVSVTFDLIAVLEVFTNTAPVAINDESVYTVFQLVVTGTTI